MKWEFNKDYKDYGQVDQFYEKFLKMHNDITKAGQYAYNEDFEGKLGIDDARQEKTAIYLLQDSKRDKARKEKINNLLSEGFFQVPFKGDGISRFKKVVQVGTDYSQDSVKEYENARIVFKGGYLYGILPKGNKTKGVYIQQDRAIFAKN